MKNLIEKNIIAKSFRCIESMHHVNESPSQSETESKKSSRIQLNQNTRPSCQRQPPQQKQNQLIKVAKCNKNVTLKQKYDSQQVSCLYSEHIYKSLQRDYIIEAQLEKYKAMLEAEKKDKLHLLSQQKELKFQITKLAQENKIILFALDSMTVKLEMQSKSSNKSRQLRRQTAQLLKSQFGQREVPSLKKYVDEKFRVTSEQDCESDSETNSEIKSDEMGEIWEKVKRIKNEKRQFNNTEAFSIKNLLQTQQKNEAKITQVEASLSQAMAKIEKCQIRTQGLEQENQSYCLRITDLTEKLREKQQQINKITSDLMMETSKNKSLERQLNQMKENEIRLIAEKDKSDQKARKFQKQLKFLQDQYQEREEKEKQCVNTLQKFSKDLKLSDEKIQHFLKEQFSEYCEQNGVDLNGAKKTYNEQLSYILHLCKKKETLYENLVQQFKQRMKQDDFRAAILQKKLNNFAKHQEELRYLVSNQPDKDLIFRKIMRFGH